MAASYLLIISKTTSSVPKRKRYWKSRVKALTVNYYRFIVSIALFLVLLIRIEATKDYINIIIIFSVMTTLLLLKKRSS